MRSFDATTTTDMVMEGVDLAGRTAVITGASSGLGAEAAKVFAKAGATVVMAARDLAKAERVAAAICDEVAGAKLATVEMDLADLRSVRDGAADILGQHEVIDILLNNAGVMCVPQGYTEQGCEMHFGTNHVGHFLWTGLLAPAVKRAHRGRIVVLSSAAHRYSDINFDDINYRSRPYDKWKAYGQSKTANILFGVALAKRLGEHGITVNSVHPGVIETELSRSMTLEERESIRAGFKTKVTWKTIRQGAATSVWAAVSSDLDGVTGKYLLDCQIASEAVEPSAPGYAAYAVNESSAEKLWDISERIVGQRMRI